MDLGTPIEYGSRPKSFDISHITRHKTPGDNAINTNRRLSPLTKGELRIIECTTRVRSLGTSKILEVNEVDQFRKPVWITDEGMNAFFNLMNSKYLRPHRSHDEEITKPPICCVMNTFFYAKLMSNGHYSYEEVKNWLKRKLQEAELNFTDLNIILVPINISNSHWVLVSVNLSQHIFTFYDPLRCQNHLYAMRHVSKYMKDEMKSSLDNAEKININKWRAEINPTGYPLQEDCVSCGIFIMFVAEYLARGQKPAFTQSDIHTLRRRALLYLVEEDIYST